MLLQPRLRADLDGWHIRGDVDILRLERDTLAAAEVPVLALHEKVEVLARGALLAAGYHRHKGGEGADVASQNKALAVPSTETILAEYKETDSSPALLDLIKAADAGNQRALSDLRVLYAAMPGIATTVSSWQWALEREIIGGEQPGIQETFAARANQWRKRLAGDDATPLERLLVNRVVLDQLHALKMDNLLHAKLNGAPISLAQGEYHHKQAERARRRVVRSMKALAEARRLTSPVVQVNVAGDVRAGERKPAA